MQIIFIVLFLLYIIWTGFLWSRVLTSVFGIREKYISIPLGIFTSLLTLSFASSIFVVLYKITLPIVFLIYIFSALLPFVLCKKIPVPNVLINDSALEREGIFPKRKFLLFCFSSISFLQILILLLCQSDRAITSPWQVVDSWYLYNFFLLTFLLGVLLFSKISYQIKFVLIIAYSVLLHLYLPLSHVMPWGGDVWRMMGVEQKLLSGQSQLPVLPQVLLNPYKYTYGQLWGIMTLLSKTLGVSLLALHRWFMAIVWGITLPVLSLQIGKILFVEKKKAFVFAALSAFPFALQAIGSISVSVSFGFLTFLYALMLWFIYLQEKNIWQKRIVLTLAFLMLFGYALYAILFYFVILLSFLLQNRKRKNIFFIGLGIAALLLFPSIDFILGFSHWPSTFSFWNFFKQSIGQFVGWYFARPLQAGEIASANIVFNHVPKASFVANIFSGFRWPLFVLSIFLFASIAFAFYTLFKKEKPLIFSVLMYVFLSVVGGYVLGWYILTGDRVFVRRLDSVLAMLLLLFTLYGLYKFDFSKIIQKYNTPKKYTVFFILLTVLSFSATTIYATGPDVRVVSRDEYTAAQYIFTQEQGKNTSCVLSDTWVLLALEALSSSNIVGGGFPMDKNFGQAERVRLYNEFIKNPDSRIIPQIQNIVSSSYCYVVLSREDIGPRGEERVHDFLGNLLFKSGSILVWKMELKKP